MNPWYKVVTLRKEVREGRSFSPDEFAIDESEISEVVRRRMFSDLGNTRVRKRVASLPVVPFPSDSAAVPDSPRLALIVLDPDVEWQDDSQIAERIGHWTKERGQSPRLYPGSLVWCARKPGRELRDKVTLWLAWQRVAREVVEGVLGGEFDRAERADIQARLREAEEAAKDEVWAGPCSSTDCRKHGDGFAADSRRSRLGRPSTGREVMNARRL